MYTYNVCIENLNRVYPLIQMETLGGSANFTCNGCKTSPKWYYENTLSHPQSLPKYSNVTITLYDLTYDHSGYYYCYGRIYGKDKHFLAKGKLQVFGNL